MPPPVQLPVRRRDDIWERHKSTLQQLYQVQRKKLVDIKTIMERDYDFPTTPLSTYDFKLRQMRVRKKMKQLDWHAVYQELQRRGGRESAVYLCGTKIPSAKAWKEIGRSGAMSVHSQLGPRRPLPQDVVVRTPSPGCPSSPLPMVPRRRSNDSSRGIISSQTSPVALQQVTRPSFHTTLSGPNRVSVLDLSSASSDYYKALIQHTPTFILMLELSRLFEKSFRPMTNGNDLELSLGFYSNSSVPHFSTLGLTIGFQDLFGSVYLMVNGLCSCSEETRFLDNFFSHFPASMLTSILVSNSRSIQTFFDRVLRYLFRRDRRDIFQLLIEAIAHDHPDWLAPAVSEYLFYAATMNCLHACQLLLQIERIELPGRRSLFSSVRSPLSGSLEGDHRLYDFAILSAVSAGYVDCARLLIEHVAQNCPLLHGCDRGTRLSPYQTGNHGVAGCDFEHPENQVTCLFFHTIFIINSEMRYCTYRVEGKRSMEQIPLSFEMETVQYALDIFIEFGLNVDALTPLGLEDAFISREGDFTGFLESEPRREARLLSHLYVDLGTPITLHPTVLDMTYNLNRKVFHYLAHYSKKIATRLTRSGLYLAAERGSDHLAQYLNFWCSEASEFRGLLEMILAEQFVLRFDLNITQTLLARGVGFGAFPQDLNLSLPLGRFVAEIKQHGIKPEILNIFNQLLRIGAIIDRGVMIEALESQGTNLLELLSHHGADFASRGTPVLLKAARLGNYEAVDWLLGAGVDINAEFHLYGESTTTTIVGAFFESFNRCPSTLSQRHASRYDIYFRLQDQERDLKKGFTPCMLKYLVCRGASLCPHPGNSQPNSLLLHAMQPRWWSRSYTSDIVEYILVAQGGVHNPLPSQPCLFEACVETYAFQDENTFRERSLSMFNLLLTSGIPIVHSGVLSSLICYKAPADLIQMVIDRGVNVNTYSGRGREHDFSVIQCTPLQAAVKAGKLELVKSLIVDNGAEINLPGKGADGMSALQAACYLNYMSDEERSIKTTLVKFLIENGADVNAPATPYGGYTALQAAAEMGDIEIAIVLLSHGAYINAPPGDEYGFCALDWAAFEGRLDMTKFLLDQGALSNEPGENGYAGAIEDAEDGGHWAVAELIQEHATLYAQTRSALEGVGFVEEMVTPRLGRDELDN
ncbi:hypothetical protein F5Y12DRAFT_529774 [Xylaria sp. FL1777]|nr:hypothetical protein F5Y12DRAFT_529774 [Xylaria sp. FL1777]